MPKNEIDEVEAVLKQLREKNPNASPQELMEAWMEIVRRDKRLADAVVRAAFDDLWKKGILGPDSTDADIERVIQNLNRHH
jgi:hypothetical protein